MVDFFNYILIHFDYEDYKIEIPNNLAQLNSSKFFIKEEKDRKEYLTINAKEIKEILKIILNKKKKLDIILMKKIILKVLKIMDKKTRPIAFTKQ